MSFRVLVAGAEPFEISKNCVRSVKFTTDIPMDSNARTKDVGATLVITGKILSAVEGDVFDSTRMMALWSKVPAERADCYRSVTIEHIAASIMVRRYLFPNAFVVDYKEDFSNTEGTGTFVLTIKQKKDKLENIVVEGGYTAAS